MQRPKSSPAKATKATGREQSANQPRRSARKQLVEKALPESLPARRGRGAVSTLPRLQAFRSAGRSPTGRILDGTPICDTRDLTRVSKDTRLRRSAGRRCLRPSDGAQPRRYGPGRVCFARASWRRELPRSGRRMEPNAWRNDGCANARGVLRPRIRMKPRQRQAARRRWRPRDNYLTGFPMNAPSETRGVRPSLLR